MHMTEGDLLHTHNLVVMLIEAQKTGRRLRQIFSNRLETTMKPDPYSVSKY